MKLGLVMLLAAALRLGAQTPGIIGTYAGGNKTFTGDGQPATSLFLSKINFIALDASGNPVMALQYRNVVVRVNPDGTLTRLAGTGDGGASGDGLKAVNATLHAPQGVAFDSAGNLYIADTFNNKVRRVGTDGVISTIAGTGVAGFFGDGSAATQAQLQNPNGVAVDALNNIYICDEGNQRIRRITPDGKIATYAGSGNPTTFQDNQAASKVYLQDPSGLAVDSSGNLYIADYGAQRVLKVAAQSGILTNFAGTGNPGVATDGSAAAASPLRTPLGVGVDSAGNVYISDSGNFQVRKVAPNGTITAIVGNGQTGFSGDGGAARNATLNAPAGLAIDSKSNLYVADRDNFRLRRVDGAGQISTVAGNGTAFDNAVPASTLLLSQPSSVSIGPDGSVFIGDTGADVVRRVGLDGLAFVVAGTGGQGQSGDGGLATSAEISNPIAVAEDSSGNIYVVDQLFSVVRKIDTSGAISTVAGSGVKGLYNGDTIPATQAALNQPYGIAVDSSGRFYIADTRNNRIRRVANGVITTVAGNGGGGVFSGDGAPATNAGLNSPTGVTFDSVGNMYIADTGNQCVRKVGLDGNISTIAGRGTVAGRAADGGPATTAVLGAVFAVATDSTGNVYFSDLTSNVVRKVALSGVISTVAGNYVAGFSGDGGSATAASLNTPLGIAIDKANNLFIADFGNDRVRVVYAAPPSFQTSASSIYFSGSSGGLATDAQSVSLSTAVAGLPYSVSISPAASWLTVNPVSGQMPAVLSVVADPSQLSPQTYTTNIVITSPQASPPTQSIAVSFAVGAVQPAKLAPETKQVAFSFAKNGAASSRTLQIGNAGGGNLSFGISSSNSTWLRTSATSGTATPSTPFSLTVTADPTGLDPGTYLGAITLTNNNGGDTSTLAVTIAVSGTPQVMILSQTGLTFTAVQGGGIVPPQTFEVINKGQGAMDWTLSTPVSWLSLNPSSGSSVAGTTPSPISVTVNPGGLQPGVYYGQISVGSPTAINSPQLLTVVLNVLSADKNPGPVVQPAGLLFTGVVGGSNPAAQTILVSDLTPNPITMGSSRAYAEAGNWFVNDVINATIQPSQPLTITVTPIIAGLLPGVYHGVLTLAFSDGTIRTVAIRLILAPAGKGSSNGLSSSVAGCSPKSLVPLFTTLAGGFGIPAAWPQAVNVRVADDCGNAMTSGSVVVSFSNTDVPLQLTNLNDGRWSATWVPAHSTTGAVLTGNAQMITPALTGTAQIVGGVQDNADPPLVTPAGVITAANSSPGAPIAPGSLISIYGAQLSDGAAGAAGLPLENTLQGAQVLMGGRNLPIAYSSAGQINAIVPYDVPANAMQSLVISRGNRTSAVVQIPVADTLPAVFSRDQSGSGQGIVVDVNNRLVDETNPMKAGDAVVIYCTGLGAVTGTVPAGSASPSDPLARTISPVSVTIGGQPAQVLFSGLTPNFAGLYQINVYIPTGVTSGNAVPLVVTAGGRASGPVTIAVH